MATLGERVAALEVLGAAHRERIESLEDTYNGGGDVEYARSVRGRLHAIEGNQRALGVVTQQRATIVRGANAVILTMCAVVTACASIVAAVYVIVAG